MLHKTRPLRKSFPFCVVYNSLVAQFINKKLAGMVLTSWHMQMANNSLRRLCEPVLTELSPTS